MKKLILAALVAALAACSGPTDIKLSEMNQPENAKKLLETLSPQDRAALQAYVMRHTMQKDIDYKMTVKEAIEARKAEVAKEQGAANAIK
ncbi:hypothetical protein [uncultured Zoogloea sp.]|uniref:hypothetical protein n=1 Tax=uncultured Zoogloea sp. TaxID=160237 RepID=UPI00261ED965|nr:hypothetical protein [uncultured Zoogloea sp.]